MASDTKNAPALNDLRLNAAEVRGFLLSNPNFLAENPELIQTLVPPSARQGDNVLDMQRFMVERLQHEVGRLKALQEELIRAGRSNLSSQSQIHAAVLALLEASTFEHVIEAVTTDFVALLDVDVVSLAIESVGNDVHPGLKQGVRVVEQGMIATLLHEGREVLLRSDIEGETTIYGAGASLVRSDVIVRVDLGAHAPACVLAMGSREAKRFHAGQGTELLCFLGRVIASTIKTWLNFPS
tara:strand:+ start:441 stop:1160 length:720 start_codon:yes stop_codon:yes gene_type:complete